jgi:hypothetical protein
MSPPDAPRLVVGLGPVAPARAGLRLAAHLAAALRAEVLGLVARDPHLEDLAGHPAVREFRVREQCWSSTPGGELARDVAGAVDKARSRLDAAARDAGVDCRFEQVSVSVLEAVRSGPTADDIILAAEPHEWHGLAPPSLADMIAASLHTPAAILVAPPVPEERSGPILVVSDDGEPNGAEAWARAVGAPLRRVRLAELGGGGIPGLPALERLVILPRSRAHAAAALAARRRSPVLIAAEAPTAAGERA